MWKAIVFLSIAVFQVTKAMALGGAAFPGYLPSHYVRSPKPVGDNGPNDIYAYISKRGRSLTDSERVIYPTHFGFELGQDAEQKVYEIFDVEKHIKKQEKKNKIHGYR